MKTQQFKKTEEQGDEINSTKSNDSTPINNLSQITSSIIDENENNNNPVEKNIELINQDQPQKQDSASSDEFTVIDCTQPNPIAEPVVVESTESNPKTESKQLPNSVIPQKCAKCRCLIS